MSAAAPPDKQDLNHLIGYLKREVAKSGVKVVLNKEATTRSSRGIRAGFGYCRGWFFPVDS